MALYAAWRMNDDEAMIITASTLRDAATLACENFQTRDGDSIFVCSLYDTKTFRKVVTVSLQEEPT